MPLARKLQGGAARFGALGDHVLLTPRAWARITKRSRSANGARTAPTPRGEYQQIIIANPDQAVFIFACARPATRRHADRFWSLLKTASS
jgi:hypothetical protein